jgi:hypothetical protein
LETFRREANTEDTDVEGHILLNRIYIYTHMRCEGVNWIHLVQKRVQWRIYGHFNKSSGYVKGEKHFED